MYFESRIVISSSNFDSFWKFENVKAVITLKKSHFDMCLAKYGRSWWYDYSSQTNWGSATSPWCYGADEGFVTELQSGSRIKLTFFLIFGFDINCQYFFIDFFLKIFINILQSRPMFVVLKKLSCTWGQLGVPWVLNMVMIYARKNLRFSKRARCFIDLIMLKLMVSL